MAKFLGSLIGVFFFAAVVIFFFLAFMKTPVAEYSLDGVCLRVIGDDGKNIPNGCKLIKTGKLRAEHRPVAR